MSPLESKYNIKVVQSIIWSSVLTFINLRYLVRIEHIALHAASTFQGAQFYLSCAQVKVTNGGSGTPGPLVAIPGVYTGRVRIRTLLLLSNLVFGLLAESL